MAEIGPHYLWIIQLLKGNKMKEDTDEQKLFNEYLDSLSEEEFRKFAEEAEADYYNSLMD